MIPARWSSSLAVFVVLSSAASGQVASGPEVGTKAEPLKVAKLTGDAAGPSADWLAERQAGASVVAFVRADVWDRPMARFLKVLDGELAEGIDDAKDARAVAVWLTQEVDNSRDYLPRAQQSLQFARTDLAVFEGDRFGPNGWSINGDAHLTVAIVRDGKIRRSFGFVSVNETDVPKVIQALKEAS